MIWCLTSQSSITTFFYSLCNHIITFSIGFANHNTTHTFISIPYICTCNMAVLQRLDMPWPETEHDHETLKHYRGIWYWQYRYNFHEQFTCFTFFKHPSNSCGFDPQLTCIHREAVGRQLRGELNFIIPTDELHHFFQRGRSTTNQMILVLALFFQWFSIMFNVQWCPTIVHNFKGLATKRSVI
jgi:hypothetical protein